MPRSPIRIAWIFAALYPFSLFAVLAATFAYHNAHSPNGVLGVFFLLFAALTLYFGLRLIAAFTDPIPSWYTSLCPNLANLPESDSNRRGIFKICAFFYVLMITVFIWVLSFSYGEKPILLLERIAWPLGFGLLILMLLTSMVPIIVTLFTLWRKRSNSGAQRESWQVKS
jgi:hypothetical protein